MLWFITVAFLSPTEKGSCFIQHKVRGGWREAGSESCFVVANATRVTQLWHEKMWFFRVQLFAVIHSTTFFAASSRQLAHQLSQANWFAPWGKSNYRFSSKEIPRTRLLRMIFSVTGTVYYLNKLQVATHPFSPQLPASLYFHLQPGWLGKYTQVHTWQASLANVSHRPDFYTLMLLIVAPVIAKLFLLIMYLPFDAVKIL